MLPWAPVIDGVDLESHPFHLLDMGKASRVPVLLGFNRDEGAMFEKSTSLEGTLAQVVAQWTMIGFNKQEIDELKALYLSDGVYYPYAGDGTNNYWWGAMRSLGDLSMSCPSRFAARRFHELSRGRSFLYYFNHSRTDGGYYPFPVVNHASEIAFVMRIPTLSGNDGVVADAMASWWGNFAADLDPNGGVDGSSGGGDTLPDWLPYGGNGGAEDAIMAIGVPPPLASVTGLKKDVCAIIEPFLRRKIGQLTK